ncbi:MAG: tRNA (guanosine(46)-N7)-methyltransferase TrmB [Chlamydiales bacterium]|nr:tRNA (guanosine(46)-N7)-methyltransferase TrmB [Chlamydiales bacterium]
MEKIDSLDILRWPFTWQERQVALVDRVLFVPKHCEGLERFQLPTWQTLFGNSLPVRLEYCSGTGDWIIEKAKQDPLSNWVAVELRFDRLKKIWTKMRRENLPNLLLFCSEAFTVTHHFLADETIEEVFINFPDPWPKRRHAKHRLIQKRFLDEMVRTLKKSGKITLVTDDFSYVGEAIKEFTSHKGFKPLFLDPFYSVTEKSYGTSYFDALWRSKGKTIYTLTFQKI